MALISISIGLPGTKALASDAASHAPWAVRTVLDAPVWVRIGEGASSGTPAEARTRDRPRHRLAPASDLGGQLAAGVARVASGDDAPLTVLRATNLRSTLPSSSTATTAEPCAAKGGATVLATGNAFAAVSEDAGATFRFIDPSTAFPSVNGGFCCDQSVLFDPIRDLFVWVMLYADDGTSNTVRIAVASGEEGVRAGSWRFVDVTPNRLGLPGGRQLDYPQIALGAAHLYLSVNAFEIGGRGRFTDTIMTRLPLDQLSAGAAPDLEYYRTADGHFTFTPAQGSVDPMYWASHDPKRFVVRVYRWRSTESAIGFTDVPVARWERKRAAACAGPDGGSWCGTADGRIQTGWVSGGTIGFMWNAPQTKGRPYPYVRAIRVDEATHRLVDEPDLVSADHAVQYPALGVNVRGDVAGVVAIGGGARFPGIATFAFHAGASPAGTLHDLVSGDAGPIEDRWGDFYCVRPDHPAGTTWIASGHVLRSGGRGPFVQPYVFRLGFPADVDCRVADLCADDGNPCTEERCVSGVCEHRTRDALACDDENQCTSDDVCVGAHCVAGAAVGCTTADACEVASCAAAAGCVETLPITLAALACRLDQGVEFPECRSDTIPIEVSRTFEKARATVRDATSSTMGRALRKLRRLLGRARRRVDRGMLADEGGGRDQEGVAIIRTRHAAIRRRLSVGCAEVLGERLDELERLASALQAAPVPIISR